VEIMIHLSAGVSPDMTMDALYAFTDCEVSISPNSCIIEDEKPKFIGVSEILKISTDRTLSILKQELEFQKAELLEQLSGLYVRENVGFDFAAWAHLYKLFADQVPHWNRLFLINDSIVGPLDATVFDHLIQGIRGSSADVVGLVENCAPVRHLQSFFLVFNHSALIRPEVQVIFPRMLSLSTKEQVIDVYETRLTQILTKMGLQCESVFPPLSNDSRNSNDTIQRWEQLIAVGFPYIKASILKNLEEKSKPHSLVPKDFFS